MHPTADTLLLMYSNVLGRRVMPGVSPLRVMKGQLFREVYMPYVNVRITRDGVTADQKRQIVEEITGTLVRVLGKRPEHTHVIIDEVEPENWGFAGMLTTEYRKQHGREDRTSDTLPTGTPGGNPTLRAG
jgi:4-oxalocrotonate tautomerase